MGKVNKHQGDKDRFGKCQICLGYIPIEYYFGIGDEIDCYECGTAYVIESKSPVKIKMIDDHFNSDEYFENKLFDDY